MELGRRTFLGGAIAAGMWPAFGIPESGRIARIGHMTDTHVVGKIESFGRVRMALELFKAKGVEMIINSGDIADTHIPEAYRLYRKVTNEVFPDAATRPREVFAYAWHDQHGHQKVTGADPLEGYELAIPETMADGKVPYNYRIRMQRKDASGVWKTFACDDLMAEFWKRPQDRDGKIVHFLHSGFFAEGEAFRLAVTPMDFFYREGRAVEIEVPYGIKAKTLWECADPMREMRYYEGGKPLEPDANGWVTPKNLHGQFRFPLGAFKEAVHDGLNQLLVDIETEQEDGEWHTWSITLRGGGCGNLSSFRTPVGKSGVMTYVMPFTLPKGKPFTGSCELSFFVRPEIVKGCRFAIRRLRFLV